MIFTQHYCGSAVCAPSRSTLITGQDTGHTPIRGNKEIGPEGQEPLPANAVTIAEMLKSAGYKTGAFGKWGLGFVGTEGDPNNQGFDEFFGFNCQRMAHRYYAPYLWHNMEKVYLKGNDWEHKVTYAPNEIQKATLKFIEKNGDTPFFAYVSFTLPHAELISPNDSLLQKFNGKFTEKPFWSSSYCSDYGPKIVHQEYCPQETPHAVYASMVARLDVYVGQIIKKLEVLGIAENTIIMFASDNGPHAEGGGDPEFFNSGGGLRGIKRDLYEGGIRTPFIVVWLGKVKAGTVSNHVSAFWDVMPTLAEVVGIKCPSESNGISFLPTLLGKKDQQEHKYLYWEFPEAGGRKAVRMGDWKGVVYGLSKNSNAGIQLYNLANDESETTDVAGEHPDIVTQIREIMLHSRINSELFSF